MAKVHHWRFHRAGGVDQVEIRGGDDLVHLHELDPKLWLALSMPTRGVELDARTLDLLDRDHDGFVRQPEVLGAVEWLCAVYRDPACALDGGDTVPLASLADGPVLAGARRLLAMLGKPAATSVTLADATAGAQSFASTVFNGDGVIPAEAGEGEVRQAIEDAIATRGSLPDRSGKPGVDAARLDGFFADARALVAWHAAADAKVLPLGEATAAAADAVRAVRAKVDDFFTRCRIAAFDPRAAGKLETGDAELAALAKQQLSAGSADLAQLPLARVEAGAALPLAGALRGALNPAWQARIGKLAADAVAPLAATPAPESLDEATWQRILDRLAPYEAWRAAKPTDRLDALPVDRVRAALAHEPEVRALLAQDLAVKPEIDAIADVERLCRYQRDLRTLLDNYVNFSRFYRARDAVFQAGTLYLDGRACKLVVEVGDAARHAALAPMAGTYLAYCECVRAGGEKKQIAAAFTAGSVDNLFVGRNGVFVDRKGRDWQATITKIIDNPISLRQAFWAPYKKLVRAIEERVARRASAKEEATTGKLEGVAGEVAAAGAAPAAAGAAVAPPPRKAIDVGTVAALGVAVGGIAAVLTAILSGVFGLGRWAPLALLALVVLISLPSMVLAFIKLRRRNLGPLLDANGWAINALTRVNVPFGTALTERARLPRGARRDRHDPYAHARPAWKLAASVLVVLLALAAGWYSGTLDRVLPDSLHATSVLGAR